MTGLLVTVIVSALVVVKGADWFVDAAAWVARRTGMSDLAVGATVVSFGTTLPEAAVSVYASWSGHAEIALGNVLGSCLANCALILGVAVLLSGFVRAGADFRRRSLEVLAVVGIIYLITTGGFLGRIGGLLLLALTVFGTALTWLRRRGPEAGRAPVAPAVAGVSYWRLLVKLIAGALMIAIGSRFLVNSGSKLAVAFGISETVIGLTLVAIGTSLPELVTAVTAGIKAHAELGLGNLIGANFLNLTMVLGLSAIVRPLPFDAAAKGFNMPCLALLTLVLLLLAWWRKGFGRGEGVLLVALYGLYMILLV